MKAPGLPLGTYGVGLTTNVLAYFSFFCIKQLGKTSMLLESNFKNKQSNNDEQFCRAKSLTK